MKDYKTLIFHTDEFDPKSIKGHKRPRLDIFFLAHLDTIFVEYQC